MRKQTNNVVNTPTPLRKSSSRVCVKCLFWAFLIFGIITAIAVFQLQRDKNLRNKVFATMCNHLTQKHSPELVAMRCQTVQDAQGSVVEIGPGPGVNMACYGQAKRITEWIGVEPNDFMSDYLKESIAKSGVEFPTSLKAGVAEDMSSIPTASIDTVVSTHVLCSVNSPVSALSEITRILKPGGKFLFFEHVKAEPQSLKCTIQYWLAPLWGVIGDGCQFRDLGHDIRSLEHSGLYEQIQITEFEASIPFPLVTPHIRGFALKKPLQPAL